MPKAVKKTIAVVGLIALFFGIMNLYSYFYKSAELPILNANPFPVVVAVTYEAAPNEWKTMPWIRLEPGERKNISATFYRTERRFFVLAESADQQIMEWLFDGLENGKMTFSNDEAGIQGKVLKSRLVEAENSNPEKIEFEDAVFFPANADELYTLTEEVFHDSILNNQGLDVESEEDGFDLIREKAQKLYASLERQMEFEQTFKNGNHFPFAFEFQMSDKEDGFKYLGVKLEQVHSHTLHGDEIKLQDGDILIGITSQETAEVTPVYAPADAYYILEKHGSDMENGGITKPLTFYIIRNGELLQIQSYFLFNPEFDWGLESKTDAFSYNFWDGLALGFRAKIVAAFSDDPNTEWKETQKIVRLKQFYPKDSNAGYIAQLFVPLPTKILKVGSLASKGRALSSMRSLSSGIGIEFAKLAVYSHQTSVKNPNSKQIPIQDLKNFLKVENIQMIVGNVNNEKTKSPIKLKKRISFGQTR